MISIIIPNYNGKELLEKYLPSVIDAVKFYNKDYEIIIVDDGSSDGSCKYLEKNFNEVKLLKLKTNLGFSKACNKGAKNSSGKFILFLNTDVQTERNFLEPLINHFENNSKDLFAVTPNVIVPGRNVNSGKISGFFRKGFIREKHQPLDEEPKHPSYTFYASGAAFLCRKDMFFELGGFDEVFSPFFYEDTDLGYRAWKRGWKIINEPKSIVTHFENLTISKDYRKDIVFEKNRLVFHWKNLTDNDLLKKHFFFLSLKLFLSPFSPKKFYFLKSFREALKLLPEVRYKKREEERHRVLKDKEIFDISSKNL